MATVKGNQTILVQFITGIALLAIASELNRDGIVNWGTVVIALAGIANIILAIGDYLNHKK